MKQGELWSLNLDPVKGREQSGFRPAVIVSGNLMNRYLDVVMVCPITSKVKNYKGNIVLKPTTSNGLSVESEVLVFHLRSVSKARLIEKIGEISESEVQHIISGLNDLLRY